MSIINEALKKAEKEKQSSRFSSRRILGKLDGLKTDARRSLLRRWVLWTGTGAACLLGFILAAHSFKEPAQSVSVEEAIAAGIEAPASIFRPGKTNAQASLSPSHFRLKGILYDKEKPLAIINGRIVGENALIDGARLLEIQPHYVRLSFKGEELTLKIK